MLDPAGALRHQRLAPEERLLAQVHENGKPSFERSALWGKIRAVQWVAHLQAKRVARAEPARDKTEPRAALEDVAPGLHCACRWAKNLEAILSRVASACDVVLGAVDAHGEDFIPRRASVPAAEELVEKLRRTGSLDGQSRKFRTAVHQFQARLAGAMLLQPCEILLDFRGIHHQQKFGVGQPVNDQVINDAARFIQQESVLALANSQSRHAIRQDALEPLRGAGTAREELPHVRNIKDAERGPHGLMLLQNATVLHRHRPAAEIDHACAQRHVLRVQRSLAKRGCGGGKHAGKLGDRATVSTRRAAMKPATTGTKSEGVSRSRTEAVASQLTFFDDNGAFLGHGHDVAFGGAGGGFEIVPIPEPSTIYSGLLILGLAGYRERRRLRQFIPGLNCGGGCTVPFWSLVDPLSGSAWDPRFTLAGAKQPSLCTILQNSAGENRKLWLNSAPSALAPAPVHLLFLKSAPVSTAPTTPCTMPTPRKTRSARHSALVLAGSIAALVAAQSTQAAILTWDNSASDFLWNTTSGDWTNGGTPGQVFTNGDAVSFDSTGIGTITVDAAGVSAASLNFNAGGIGYTLTGGAISLAGNLVDAATSGTNTINSSLSFTTGATIQNVNAASVLTLGGSLTTASALNFTGAGTTNLGGAVTRSGSGDMTITGVVSSTGGGSNSGSGNLVVTGGGAFTIAGGTYSNNTTTAISNTAAASGAMTVSAGTFQQTAGALQIGATAGTGGTLTVSGTGLVQVTGGVLQLGVAAGNAGTLNIGSGTGVGGEFDTAVLFAPSANSNVINFGGGTLKVTSAVAAATNLFGTAANVAVNIGNSGATFNTVGNTVLISSNLLHGSGASTDSLTVTGTSGTLSLTGTNTYAGGTFINSGTLQVLNDSNLGSTTSTNNIAINGGTLASTLNTPVTLNANHGLVIGSSGGTIFSNASGGNSGNFTVAAGGLTAAVPGTGTLTLNGFAAGSNTILSSSGTQVFSNPITLLNGRIIVGGVSLTNPFGTGLITVGAGTSEVYSNSNGTVWGNSFNITGNGGEGRGVLRVPGSGTFNGSITLSGNAGINADLVSTNSFNGNITGGFTVQFGGLTGSNASAVYNLAGNNTVTNLTVAGGTVAAKQAQALINIGTAITVNSGTTLGVSVGGTGEFTAANLTTALGKATIGVVGTAATLAIDTTNAGGSFTYGTALTDNGGKMTLSKIGAGTLLLTATNSYSGTTPVTGGTLALGSGGNLGTTQVTVSSGATFAVQQTASGTTNTIGNATQTLNAGGTFSMADGFTSTLAVTGGIVLNGGIISLDVAGAQTDKITSGSTIAVGGATTITINDTTNSALTPGSYTLLQAATSAGSSLGNNFSLASNTITVSGTTYNLSLVGSTNTVEKLSISAPATAQAYWTGAQGSTWGANTGGTLTNWNTTVAGGVDLGAQPGATTDVFFSATTPAPQNLVNTLGADYTINSLNFLASSPSVTIGGANTLTLNSVVGLNVASGAAAQTVNTNISLGNNQTWTNASTTGLLTIGGAINNAGFGLTTAGAGPITIGGSISGGGTFATTGTGTITLNAANTYTGLTAVGSGSTLAVTATSGLSSATVTTNNGTLVLSGGDGTLSTLANNGNGTLANSGTLQLQANGSNTSGGVSTAYLPAASTAQLMILPNPSTSMTIQLRSDSTVNFAAGGSGGIGGINSTSGVTINFDVNSLTNAGTPGSVLTFAPAASGNGVVIGRNVTVNVTGGNGDSLVLGEWDYAATAGTLVFNPTTASVTVGVGAIALANTGNAAGTEIFTLGGTAQNNTVNGTINNGSTNPSILNFTSSGSWTLKSASSFGVTTSGASAASVNLTGTGTLGLGNVAAAGVTGGYINVNSAATIQLLTDTAFGGSNPVYNLWYGNSSTGIGANYTSTLALGRATAGASNSLTHNFGILEISANGGKAVTLNVTAGPNASSALDTVAFTGLLTGNLNTVTHVLNPTGGNITIGTVGAITGTTAVTTLQLDGTTQGNAITGVIGTAGGNLPADIALVKNNTSTWTLGGANTYSAGTTLTAGTLNLNSTTALGAAAGGFTINGGAINNTSGAAIVMTNANAITIGGSFGFGTSTSTAANNLTLPGAVSNTTSGRTITLSGSGDTLTFSGLLSNAATANTITVNGAGNTVSFNGYKLSTGAAIQDIFNGSGNVSIPGVISETTAGSGLTYSGTGKLTLGGANTFTGPLDLTNGTVNLATLTNYGTAGAQGNRASASESATGDGIGLHFGAGTTTSGALQYTGSTAQSTNRQIRLSATAANAIDASGTGAGTVAFTYSAANTNLFDTGGVRTLNLVGSNTGNNLFSIILTDQAASPAVTNLTKAGSGTWALNTAQTIGGATTVNGGKLILGNGGGFAASNITATTATALTVNAGGTLAVLPGSVANASAVLGANGATNALGVAGTTTGGTLTLAAGSAFTMSGDNIYSTFSLPRTNTGTASALAPTSGAAPTLTFDLSSGGTSNVDKLAIAGAATDGAAKDVIYLNYIGGVTAPTTGAYNVITAASGLTAANFSLGTTKIYSGTTPFLLTLSGSGTTETVNVAAFAGTDAAYWTGAAGAAWNAGLTNFNTTAAGGAAVGALPTSVTDVYFSTTTPAPANLTNTLGADTTISSLNFLATAGAVNIGGTNILTINAGTGANAGGAGNIGLNVASGSAAQTVAAPIVLGNAQTWNNSSASLLTIGSVSPVQGITTGGFTLTTTGSGPISFVGPITGAGGLTDTSTGTVTLSATGNTYAGATTVRSGLLSVTGGTITATSSLDIGGSGGAVAAFSGGTITAGVNRVALAQVINSNAVATEYISGANVTVTTDTNVGFANVTGGVATGNFFLTGGSIATSGNFYVGVINGSSVVPGSATAIGTATITGGTFSVGAANSLIIGGNSGNIPGAYGTFNVVNGTSVTVPAVNSVNAGLATINIGPSSTLTTNVWTTGATNTFIDFNGGTLKSGITANSFGTAGLVLYGTGGTINANGFPTTVSGAVTNAAGSGVTALTVGTADATTVFNAPPSLVFTGGGGSGGAGYATLDASGKINGLVITSAGTYTSAPTITVAGSTETATATLTSNVTAPLNLIAAGTTLTLSGTNTPTGPINIVSGTVKNGAAGAFGTAGSPGVFVSSGATLDVNGLAINGAVTAAGTGVGGTAGALTNSGAGLGVQSISSLTLSGNATFVPTGRFEERSGATTLAPFNMNGFTLTVSGGNSGTGFHLTGGVGVNIINPGNVIVSNGAAFAPEVGTNFNGTSANSITLNSGTLLALYSNTGSTPWTINSTSATIQNFNTGALATWNGPVALTGNNVINGSLTFNGVISGAGSITAGDAAAATLTLNGANSYSGGTVINGGVGSFTVTGTGASPLGATTGALAVNNTNTVAGDAVILNLSTTAPTTTGSLSGTISTPSSLTNTVTINNGGQLLTVNQTTTGAYAGVIAGSGGFALGSLSTNSLSLTGTNSYTGNTTISAGTLQLGNGGATGRLTGTTAITNNGNLTINRSNAFSQATDLGAGVAITGTGAFTQVGIGTTTLTAANTYSGATTVTAGALAVSGSISGTTVVNNSGTLLLNSSTNANNIVGNGTATPNPSTQTFTGSVGTTTYTGTNGSTLRVGNTNPGGVTNSFASLTLSGASTLDFASNNTNNNFIFGTLDPATAAALTAGTSTLNIANWSGTVYDPSATQDTGTFGDNQSRLLFATDPGFAANTAISGITFGGSLPGMEVSFGTQYEIVPIPEPSTIYSGLLILGLAGYRERRRLRKLLPGLN